MSVRIGVNFDPSHRMWMGADPLKAIAALDDAIYHVHAKDTRIDPTIAALNGRIEFKTNDRASERAWNYVELCRRQSPGHSASVSSTRTSRPWTCKSNSNSAAPA